MVFVHGCMHGVYIQAHNIYRSTCTVVQFQIVAALYTESIQLMLLHKLRAVAATKE